MEICRKLSRLRKWEVINLWLAVAGPVSILNNSSSSLLKCLFWVDILLTYSLSFLKCVNVKLLIVAKDAQRVFKKLQEQRTKYKHVI